MEDKETKGKGRERKSMEGVVARVVTNEGKRSKIFVKPEEGDAVPFKFKPERIKVELNGEEAAPEDIEKGQRAAVQYITVVAPEQNVEQNIILSLKLEPAAEGGQSGGEKTG